MSDIPQTIKDVKKQLHQLEITYWTLLRMGELNVARRLLPTIKALQWVTGYDGSLFGNCEVPKQ